VVLFLLSPFLLLHGYLVVNNNNRYDLNETVETIPYLLYKPFAFSVARLYFYYFLCAFVHTVSCINVVYKHVLFGQLSVLVLAVLFKPLLYASVLLRFHK